VNLKLYLEMYLAMVNRKAVDREGGMMGSETLIIGSLSIVGM
jgi:hypothetical protein